MSMGTIAARKFRDVVGNVRRVLAIELLAATQGLEFLKPLKPAKPLTGVVNALRQKVKPWDGDRYMAPDIEAADALIAEGNLLELVGFQLH